VRFPASPFSLLLWTSLLFLTAASGFGQTALVQQKTMAAASGAAPAATGAFNGAGIGTGTRVIDGLWQFHVGDDPRWAQPGFDDSGWQRLPIGRSSADAEDPGYTGFRWYRRQLSLDPSDKSPLSLYIRAVYVVEVYWNGAKVGGMGTPPPHTAWYWNQPPVAIPLPSSPGARSATLAFRVWTPDDWPGSPFVEIPQLGYAPLIHEMRERYVEHRLRRLLASVYTVDLIEFCVGLAALILWLRSRSQWILLCVGTYYVLRTIANVSQYGSISFTGTEQEFFFDTCDWIVHIAFLFLILLLAGLPNRPGVRGFRFWEGVCIAVSVIVLPTELLQCWRALLLEQPPSALYRFLDALPDIRDYVETVSELLVLVACLVWGKPGLPRRLFMAVATVNVFTEDLDGFINWYPRLGWLLNISGKRLFEIYGSPVSFYAILRLLLLAAIVYAVSDQLRRELAEQRRTSAELKAAQEVQTVLVAAEERGAPGYAVASVYRPASEVGGDFFQVIPLDDDGTLVVAGDVSGKGLRAAMAVSLIVGAMRMAAEQDPSPAAVLAALNRRLVGRTQGGFATCCAVRIDPMGNATLANAGHCQPYLDGHEVELPAGLPLGLVDGITYDEVPLTIAHGQQLTLVSDGVVEARNPHGELYGFDRLSQLMQQRPTAEHVATTAIDFGQDDDITVLTVTRLTAEPDAAVQLSALSPAPA